MRRRAYMRNLFETLIERIELDPNTREFKIKYRLPVTGVRWRPHGDSVYALQRSKCCAGSLA